MPITPTEPVPSAPSEGGGSQDPADSFMRQAAVSSPHSLDEFVPPVPLRPGEVIGDRFVVERRASQGGMGVVYRALDPMTGDPVAVKVMAKGARDLQRFAQEARVLADLMHPTIVRYVAHGTTAEQQPFLVMEWLEGEDLAHRLARAGLSVADSLTIARRVSEGLSVAHERGALHRDVKPGNVFLVGGDPARAKLIDFGIVRLQISAGASTARPMTGTGSVVGTVGYMSPEQATADRALDARTDVFALGCVLFECLTGKPAFAGVHVVAVLAKVLREEAPRVRQLRPELPPALDELVARLLSKDRSGRPEDGAAVLRELEALETVTVRAPEVGGLIAPGLSSGEQRLVGVLLAVVPGESDPVKEIVLRYGGDLVRLANDALLVTFHGRGSASEQVVAAALCALDLYRAFPSSRMALSIAKARTTATGRSSPVIDQAAVLFANATSAGIRMDDATAGLLGERFELQADEKGGATLLGRRSEGEAPRTLLGKPTPCVGRDKELTLLEGTLRECIEESVARAVLVTGPAGQGKSRLRHEFVGRVRDRGGVTTLVARADPMGAGSSFMLVRQLVRQAIGLREGDPAPEQHQKLRAHVENVGQGRDFARIADFLGELIGVPSTDRPSPQLRAARNDPQIMGGWLARSFGDWLEVECRARPLLVVLEDLHWGDQPSVTHLREGLRALASSSLMVLALGRPEVHETFPQLFAGCEANEVSLGRLTPRAAARLTRAALGETVAEETCQRIVDRADGNAFYLEELIRRAAEGEGDTLPETVIALVQSRLERLEPPARRIVRAASVFGGVFWSGGVASLLGPTSNHDDLAFWLRTLTAREVLSLAPESRFPDDHEYTFRHGLLREAAYSMLTETDRTAGHKLAGDWLERAGEKDPLTLADHFERGGDATRAAPWLVTAASMAVDSGDAAGALGLCDRGLRCEPTDLQRGRFLSRRGAALFYLGRYVDCATQHQEAMGLLPAASSEWFVCASTVLFCGVILENAGLVLSVLPSLMGVPPEPSGPYGGAVHCACLALGLGGKPEFALPLLERAEAVERTATELDPAFVAEIRLARGWLQLLSGKDLGGVIALASEGLTLAARAGLAQGRSTAALLYVEALSETGHTLRTEQAASEVLSFCNSTARGWIAFWLALAKLYAGRIAEAQASLEQLIATSDLSVASDSSVARGARRLLARVLVAAGDLEGAAREANAASNSTFGIQFGVLGSLAMRRGSPEEALSYAERGLESLGARMQHDLSFLYLMRAEALQALGRTADARAAIRDARDHILRIAATLDGDPDLRGSFLTQIDTNERTLDLARQWLGEGPAPPASG
jgi:tetratricopeptide (TPR) repeat protein